MTLNSKEWLVKQRQMCADSRNSANAPNLAAQGAYAWMAISLAGKCRVLDIGCGDGSGVIELAKRGHAVISIEENPVCITRAVEKCEHDGVEVN